MAFVLFGCDRSGGDQPGIEALTPRLREGLAAVESESFSFIEFAPGLRVDRARGAVEFDGRVAVDCHDPQTPDVWLELIVTGPDTREHEALVVTTVRPSLIHAALLLAGADPGTPGRIDVGGDGTVVRTEAVGTTVEVLLVLDGGLPVGAFDWVRLGEPARAQARGSEESVDDRFVFAGSRLVGRRGQTMYDADGTGVIVGLATFGSEVVALRRAVSPETGVDAPVWMVRNEAVPEVGSVVRVRLVLAD